jgi:hypothetical protein
MAEDRVSLTGLNWRNFSAALIKEFSNCTKQANNGSDEQFLQLAMLHKHCMALSRPVLPCPYPLALIR